MWKKLHIVIKAVVVVKCHKVSVWSREILSHVLVLKVWIHCAIRDVLP